MITTQQKHASLCKRTPFKTRRLALVAAFCVFASLIPTSPASAASQNELLVSVAFDGQSFTGDDPLDSGTGIATDHTPGSDERDDNGVVRTFDLVGYRVDYNINEEGQTGATLTLTLPPNMTWVTPSATVSAEFPEGMVSGCLAGSSITSSGTAAPHGVTGTNDILTCAVGTTDNQGSNGTIYPVAQLLTDTDGQIKTLNGVLDTTEQPCDSNPLCSGAVSVESSGAPSANFKKGLDVLDSDRNVIGREPNEFYALERNGVDGWVSLYTIEFRTAGNSVLGSEPIDDSYPISFYDHFWDFPSTTVFATDDGTLTGTSILEDGRTACGNYDGDGGYPAAAPGTWTCSQPSFGGQTVQMDLVGYDTATFTSNADQGPNTSIYSTAQIALWTPDVDLQAKEPKQITNSISQSPTPPTGVGQASPILFGSVTGPVPESTIIDNDASALYNLVTSTPGPRSLNNYIRFMNGPFQARQFEDGARSNNETVIGVDGRDADVGGIGGYETINTCANNGVTSTNNNIREGWCGEQEVPRGKVVTISSAAIGRQTGETSVFDQLHQCVALDTTHMSLIALPSAFDVNIVEGVNPSTGVVNPNLTSMIRTTGNQEAATIGGYTAAPNSGPLAQVYAGTVNIFHYHNAARGSASNDSIPRSAYVVEFATSTNPVRQIDTPAAVTTPVSVAQHDLTCNNDDAAGPGWVDATDVALVDASFDPDGDGLYQGIDRVRVRMIDPADWLVVGTVNGSVSLELNLQAQVHEDPAVDSAGQELFAFSSRATGPWDPSIENAPSQADCWSSETSWGGVTTTTSGWCNLGYDEDANLSPNPSGGALFYDNGAEEWVVSGFWTGAAHADKLFIVEANIGLKKTNLDGLSDIADNGEQVVFGMNVSTVGATSDELNDVSLVDNLPAGYSFVQFNDDADGQCSFNGAAQISCDFGDLVGGWSDYVEIVVEVQGTEADTKITNTAVLTADRANGDELRRTSSAFSRTPGGYEEQAIIKSVNTIEGDCVAYPREDVDVPLEPQPADWADRCEMTDYDTGQLLFDLSLTNEGNVTATGVTFVDVFPHVLDAEEAPSATGVTGDGRSPESDLAAGSTLSFVDFTGPDVVGYWITADSAEDVSRDPVAALAGTTWCDTLGGAIMNPGNTGSGACPAANDEVTAIYATMADVGVAQTVTGTLELDSTGHECDDIWTNSFGARVDRTLLPIRSNDVSIMVNCEFDLALTKTIDPDFVPAADWLTPGTSTITFELEVTNQGDRVEDFDVTDYVDTAQFTFDTSNTSGVTGGDQSLAYIWDGSDPAAPVVSVTGELLRDESVTIPITLVVEEIDGDLANWAEISRFDSDGDPTNGDSDPTNPGNPTWGELVDDDSTPDADELDDAQPSAPGAAGDDVINGDGSGSDPVGGDEDDHDVAGIPLFDLELIKTLTTSATNPDMAAGLVTFDITVTNQGTADAHLIEVTEYPPAGLAINTTETDAGLPAGVSSTGTNTFEITGPIAPGDFITFPVTFDITDVTEAPFLNAAEVSDFDVDADPTNPASPMAVDVDSTPDVVDGDDVIDHNLQNYDPDGDGDLNEPTVGDEDDHDTELFTPPVRIGNKVWIDADADGVQDADEDPVPGVTVNLLDENGDPVLDAAGEPITTTTDANGEYYFDVPAGTYIIEFDLDTLPADYVPTSQDTGADDGADSDADPLTGQTGLIDVSDVSTMLDTDGDGILDDYTHDLGIVPPVRIGNKVWEDLNGDGVQDADEDPVPGVTVNLLDENGDPVLDAAGEPITTTTDANGEYYFDVPPGDYIIEFDRSTLPADTVLTGQDAGADDGADSDADPLTGQTAPFNVDPFSGLTDTDGDGILDDYTHDAGIVEVVRIGNKVWLDADADGVQDADEDPVPGVTVNLLDENGDPVLDAAGNPITTTTDANGEYYFDVAPGTYVVEFDPATLPSGTQFTTQDGGADDGADSDADPLTGHTAIIDVSDPTSLADTDGDGILDDYTHDAGLVETAMIGNKVWIDADNDGVQDPDEAPVPGVIVNLLDENGDPVLDAAGEPITTTTDANGEYYFEVPAGDYIIEFDTSTLPAGTSLVPANTGSDDAADSDPDPASGLTGVISVDPSTLADTDGDGVVDDYTHDAGITSGIEIGNFVWIDLDGDGIQDPGETPVAGVTVELLDADGNPVLDATGTPITTVTDADGSYGFIVDPGEYQIQFSVPDGYAPTLADQGSDDSADSDAGPFGLIPTFTVTATGGNDLTLDMGLVETQTISGVVWNDTNRDGIQDAGELIQSGVKVELFDANGNAVLDADGNPRVATTDADGAYEFNVPPGQYRIRITAPDGTVITPGAGSDNDAGTDGLTSIIDVPVGVDVPHIDGGLVAQQVPSPLAFTGTNSSSLVALSALLMLLGLTLVAGVSVRRRRL